MPETKPIPVPAPRPDSVPPGRFFTRRGPLRFFARHIRRWLAPKALRRKLRAITMIVCTLALFLTGVMLFTFDAVSEILAARRGLSSVARVAVDGSREALKAGSRSASSAVLENLMEHPGMSGAILYGADGFVFARSSKTVHGDLPLRVAADSTSGGSMNTGGFQHFEPVMDGGKRIGTLGLHAGLSPLWARLRWYALVTLIVAGIAALVARVLFGLLQGLVADPIADLCRMANTIAERNDYSLRAEKRSDDEVGGLAVAFNKMLAEIQKRDDELSQAQVELEARVLARTSELHVEVVERKQAEQALKDSEVAYRNLFENNPMPMFVMDLETLDICAVNNAAVRHYGYAQEEFLLMSLHVLTKGASPIEIERAFRGNAKSFDAGEWKHRKRNGEIIEVHLTAHAIVFAGKVTKIVLANDVTERNRAQRQVEEMHRRLVEASRAAGMAEVATGVLHNVGNVLNSVNVSVTLLGDGVRKSKLPGVRKAAELLDANRAELPKFFSEGGKGTMLPGYLATLAAQLEAEQQGRLAEIEQLATNIAHIKEIVAMQQDYARVSGVIESWSPHSLIEEALRITSSDLDGASVRVQIDCPADLPQVSADRHKVTQILINLFTNARQAMAQTPAEKRTLSVSAARQGTMMAIRVRDNGCGIPAENLTRIFNHGFTTKPDGHGFGLHSAANAAKETGGRLTGESDGPGLGATFTLELAVAEAAPVAKAA